MELELRTPSEKQQKATQRFWAGEKHDWIIFQIHFFNWYVENAPQEDKNRGQETNQRTNEVTR